MKKQLLFLFVLLVFASMLENHQQKRNVPVIEIAGHRCVLRIHAQTFAKSKIHVEAQNCKVEIHDVHGNVVDELPEGFNGTLHLHLNCSKDGYVKIWLDNGIVTLEK